MKVSSKRTNIYLATNHKKSRKGKVVGEKVSEDTSYFSQISVFAPSVLSSAFMADVLSVRNLQPKFTAQIYTVEIQTTYMLHYQLLYA